MAWRAAALMEMVELVEQFLLRLPPDDPASLVSAALVCKLWHRILADRGFRRRFCERNRRPPILGFLYRAGAAGPLFIPTSTFRPRKADFQDLYAIPSRHGRVLLARSRLPMKILLTKLAIWDPISGNQQDLPLLPAALRRYLAMVSHTWNAAVLCASTLSSACDSIECRSGHFLVVLMITAPDGVYVYVYSSQAGMWTETTSGAQDPDNRMFLPTFEPGTLAGNALYFWFYVRQRNGIIKYDLGIKEISLINLPFSTIEGSKILLTTAEYGVLGIATAEKGRLQLWSGEAGSGGHLAWSPSIVIELNMVLPANTNINSIRVVAFLHGHGAFLVSRNDGVFIVDLDSNQARNVSQDLCLIHAVPCMCFCTPALDVTLTNTGEGPGASVPSP